FVGDAFDGAHEIVVRANAAKVARSEEIAGIGEMHVAIGKGWEDDGAVEIDQLDADTARRFVERDDSSAVDEHRVVRNELTGRRVERVESPVEQKLHAL